MPTIMVEKSVFAASALLALCACGSERPASPAPQVAGEAITVEPTNALPASDIYVAEFSFNNAAPSLGEAYSATQGGGYNNQPSFIPGEEAFFFVAEVDGGKTDIWRYDVSARGRAQITNSAGKSEYSPRLAPGGGAVSYIQESADGAMTRVHRMALPDGAGAAVVEFAPLGYYAFFNDGALLAVFLRTQPPGLHLVDVASGMTRTLYENIGRGLQSDGARRGVYFTRVTAPGAHELMHYDGARDIIDALTVLPGGAQDYFVLHDGEGAPIGVLAGNGAALYFKSLGAGAAQDDWRRVADFAPQGVTTITRIAVSDDMRWIALVTQSD